MLRNIALAIAIAFTIGAFIFATWPSTARIDDDYHDYYDGI
jgi:hypothetical protein